MYKQNAGYYNLKQLAYYPYYKGAYTMNRTFVAVFAVVTMLFMAACVPMAAPTSEAEMPAAEMEAEATAAP
ncbi:MAG: hypothetical protein KDE53_11005, partial [Caldilineaceae bacterium]|nr:hypothetical protein [Caldilineaceae bacterium]